MLVLLLSPGCRDHRPPERPSRPVSVELSSPVTMPGSTAPRTAEPPPAPPPTFAPRALWTGKRVTVPPVFQGLEPGMPLLAARVLFPQLPDQTRVPANVPNLRFDIVGGSEIVDALTVRVVQPTARPNLVDLRGQLTAQWGPPSDPTPCWVAPTLRACLKGSTLAFEARQSANRAVKPPRE